MFQLWERSPRSSRLRWLEEQESELSWALAALVLTLWEAAWENSQFAFWDRFSESFHAVLGGFCGSVWAGFFCSSLSVFWQSCLRSQLHCLEVCHHCFVMSLICHPDLTAAALHHLQRQCWPVCSELGELQFGWAHCKLHVLRPLAMAPAKVLTVFSLLCKTCFEQFISWP